MGAILQFQRLGPWNGAGDPLDLLHGPVLVVLALNGENRASDARQVFLDIPGEGLGAARCRSSPERPSLGRRDSGRACRAGRWFHKVAWMLRYSGAQSPPPLRAARGES